MSLALEKTPIGYVISGMTSVGYVQALGMTEAQAMQKAMQRTRELQRANSERLFKEFCAKNPWYFQQREKA